LETPLIKLKRLINEDEENQKVNKFRAELDNSIRSAFETQMKQLEKEWGDSFREYSKQLIGMPIKRANPEFGGAPEEFNSPIKTIEKMQMKIVFEETWKPIFHISCTLENGKKIEFTEVYYTSNSNQDPPKYVYGYKIDL
jgi:hypothetical protein